MRAILLLIAVMISYGSLYPFHFAANHHWLAEAAGLFSMPTLRMGRGDLVGNLLLFVPYGLVAALHVDTRRPVRASGTLALLLGLGLLLALALQLAQIWVPSRVPELNDVIANGVGMLLGTLAGWVARSLFPNAAMQLPRALAPAMLMLLWIGYQWAPLVPTLDLQNISNALKPLVRSPQVDAVRALHTTLAWLAFFKLWELAAGKTLSTPVMAMAALGIVGAKLFIVGASISATNALALGLALVCLPWRQHAMAVPVLSIAMFISLAASGLAPYEPLGQAQAFHWIPFTGMLQGSMGTNLLNLAEKSFFYGALIMLIGAPLSHPLAAAGMVAFFLGLIEAVQLCLPGRVAESTDPVLALILGLVIRLLSVRGKPA